MLIEDNHSIIRDVLAVPPHSKKSPAFMGTCTVNNKENPDIVFAVLKNTEGMETLPAEVAWRIDQQKALFIKIPIDGLQCPLVGIFTEDGGL
jgi:hypothetical protein